jgi:hypothetical protein
MGDDSHRLRATGGDSPRFAKYLFQLLVPASIHFSVLLTVLIVLSLVVITTNNGRQPWAFQGSLSECALIRCPTVLTRMGRLRGPGVFLGPRGYTSGTYCSRIGGANCQVKVRCHSVRNLSAIIAQTHQLCYCRKVTGQRGVVRLEVAGVYYDPLELRHSRRRNARCLQRAPQIYW